MAQMRRCRTFTVPKSEVDFMVVEYTCLDNSLLKGLGAHSKVSTWQVLVSGRPEPIAIELLVDRGLLGGTEVRVTVNEQPLFPPPGAARDRERLREDFLHRWSFRGSVQGINERHFYEARPPLGLGARRSLGQWCPCTLTKQRADGHFEATVAVPDGQGGVRELAYPAIPAEDIREASTGRPLLIPQRTLDLRVPWRDPLGSATLVIDGHELITHHFVRRTPSLRCALAVDRDRSTVSANVGHSVLSHFLSREVRRGPCQGERWRKQWRLQVGPSVEHTVELERRSSWSRIVTLSIDGERLVESSAEDIDCGEAGKWRCGFRLTVENFVDFQVYEVDRFGNPLDSLGTVTEPTRFSHDCVVTVEDERDMSTSTLCVNGLDFKQLPPRIESHPEPQLKVSVEVLRHQYGLMVPFVVAREKAPVEASSQVQVEQVGGAVALFRQPFLNFPSLLPSLGRIAIWCNAHSPTNHEPELLTDEGEAESALGSRWHPSGQLLHEAHEVLEQMPPGKPSVHWQTRAPSADELSTESRATTPRSKLGLEAR